MTEKTPITIVWLRRDLRLDDNTALFNALKNNKNVLPLFIFDTQILDELPHPHDPRVEFIHQILTEMQQDLLKINANILVKYGKPLAVFKAILKEFSVKNVYTNHDYEPYAKDRDEEITHFLKAQKIDFFTFKDQCIFEKDEILSGSNTPYTVFTPYSKKWKVTLNDFYLKSYPTEKYFENFLKQDIFSLPNSIISLQDMEFEPKGLQFPTKIPDENIIKNYTENRNIPHYQSTTRIGIHLRFGTLSIRKIARLAMEHSESWLNELIWRDFYMNILWHFPHVVTKSFRPNYDKIQWLNNADEFEKWCEGKTGYPIVDAGMRELNATGFMHNRVRMIVASFLTKHLLIDWRWGEAYFAEKLLDYDLSANNGGWQWASSSGCDAQPYFRIFNPTSQMETFDKERKYIKKWIPEYGTNSYPKPIVEHTFARNRCLEAFKAIMG